MSNYRSSNYYHDLKPTPKRRYEQKLLEMKLFDDPFTLRNDDFDRTKNTLQTSLTILIKSPSQYTTDSLKAYKSLNGYLYVASGLVHNAQWAELGGQAHFLP